MNRKRFLQVGGIAGAFVAVPSVMAACSLKARSGKAPFFDISLAEWSLNKTLFGGELNNLEFPATAKNEFGITAVEYVNQFFKDKAEDNSYLNELNTRCDDIGVDQVLIMIDGEGALAAADDRERKQAVENHYKWVEAAKHLDCDSIRVNARGDGSWEEQKKAAVDGLGSLATFAKDYEINVIVENHGGHSSNGKWLASVMEEVNMDNCGTLPDFGNFCIENTDDGCAEEYDRYQGVEELMPYAKGVSAKTYVFNQAGRELNIDYSKLLQIVKDAGYTGHVGIEYEGTELSEAEGIKATKELLMKVGGQLSD